MEGYRPTIRLLHLVRRNNTETFGFSLRGGKEHGTGFFVSSVQIGSVAYSQGLKVGDQIMRVNGFPVDHAVHTEIMHLIQSLNQVSLKVRTAGIIPVKEKRSDPLTWCLVQDSDEINAIQQIFIEIAPKSKLGCGICKGPEWKPGIFIQYTKEDGIAREAGLKPGDQIIQCNGVLFTQTSFTEAVNVLRSSRQLDLILRKGSGVELFPGESSGYNSSSSASSVSGNGENRNRLPIVPEEKNSRSAPCAISKHRNEMEAELTPTRVTSAEIHQMQDCEEVDVVSINSSSLNSALSQELLTRSLRNTNLEIGEKSDSVKSMPLQGNEVKEEKNHHLKLMMEFQMVHQKMFGANTEHPPSPSPDYDDNEVETEDEVKQMTNNHTMSAAERVEMISIESFTLNNPPSPKPKPPQTYFKPNNGVAVTIGEYPTHVDRKAPNRFQFLSNPSNSTQVTNTSLQSELAKTLSRSNLKNQSDASLHQQMSEQHISGILKNNNAPSSTLNKISVNQQKSISFGEITTVICNNEQQ